MATIESLGKRYSEYLEDNCSSATVIEDIAKKILSITYTEGGKLTQSDLDKLIDAIESEYLEELRVVTESEDSTDFISMIKAIREEVKNG